MKKLTRFPLFLLLALLLWPKPAAADSLSQVADTVNQNVGQMQRCLSAVNLVSNQAGGEYFGLEDSLIEASESIDDAHACLSPMLNRFLDSAEMEIAFHSSIPTSSINISGEFSFSLADLEEDDGVLSLADVRGFFLDGDTCQLENMTDFSYQISDDARKLLEVQYASALLDHLKQETQNNYIVGLSESLTSATEDSFRILDIFSPLSDYPGSGDLLPFGALNSYVLSSDSSALTLACESDGFTLTMVEGEADGHLSYSVQPSSSRGSIYSYSFGEQTMTIGNGRQSVTIRRRQTQNNVEISYQDMPIALQARFNDQTNPVDLFGFTSDASVSSSVSPDVSSGVSPDVQ